MSKRIMVLSMLMMLVSSVSGFAALDRVPDPVKAKLPEVAITNATDKGAPTTTVSGSTISTAAKSLAGMEKPLSDAAQNLV